ncbi:MAG TPA: cation transporter [Thermoanaerobaculia bacterium]|nr:cation transporter [Thermoanaerobaculia bacterium]
MADSLAVQRDRLAVRAGALAWTGNVWHLIEFAVAVGAGVAASSTALVGFGMDSLVEVFASSVIIWRFGRRRRESAAAERRAQQLVAVSFFLLAGYVLVDTLRTLAGGRHPQVSWPGIALAAFTAATMPLLAIAKRRVGGRLGSAATVSEGSQNMVCAYLSVALLVGLGANAAVGAWWADSLAALLIAGVAVREGIESWRGQACCDAC